MNKRRIATLIVYGLIVLCVVLIALMLKSSREEEAERLSAAAALEEARRPYTAELAMLKNELVLLEKEQRNAVTGTPTVHFVFSEPDERVITEALPMLEASGYTGMVAVSEGFFTGDAGCMTTAQLAELTGKGWGVCLSATADTDIPALFARVRAEGFTPEAVYYPAGDCTVQAENAAASLGIPVILQYGATALTDGEGSLWVMEARGTLDAANYDAFLRAMNSASGLALTHGWQNPLESFTQQDFQDTLEFVGGYVTAGQMKVTTIADASALHDAYVAALCEAEEALRVRQDEILQRIEELEHLLNNLGNQNLRQ